MVVYASLLSDKASSEAHKYAVFARVEEFAHHAMAIRGEPSYAADWLMIARTPFSLHSAVSWLGIQNSGEARRSV